MTHEALMSQPNTLLPSALEHYKQGNLKEAEALCHQILATSPQHRETTQLLGGILIQTKRHAEAIPLLKALANALPTSASAQSNLGIAYLETSQFDAAIQCFKNAIKLKSDFTAAFLNLGIAYRHIGHSVFAFHAYEQALKLNPNLLPALKEITAVAYTERGRETALHYFDRLLQLEPSNTAARISRELLLPDIISSKEAIPQIRKTYEEALDKLLAQDIPPLKSSEPIINGAFYLAYHGLDDRSLQEKLAKLYLKAYPMLHFTAPHCINYQPPKENEKIKIGIVSRYFYDHSVSRCYNKIIKKLCQHPAFEVTLFSLTGHHRKDETLARMASVCQYFIETPSNFTKATSLIANQKLDMLFYTDIGMDALTYLLAFARLAPAQAVLGGHPLTTGIPTMDYYISSNQVEAENTAKHYSETLVLLDHMVLWADKPAPPKLTKTKEALGLNPSKTSHVCPMKLQKLHPDFDSAIAAILSQDSEGIIYFFDDVRNTTWRTELLKRFSHTIPQHLQERIRFLPFQSKEDFAQLMLHADVVLDSFHFGAGTTAYMVLALGVPIVTLPTAYLRTRTTCTFYHWMGIEDLIAKSPEEYIDLALKLGKDKEFQKTMRSKILECCDTIFDNAAVADDLVAWIKKTVYVS